MRWSEISEGRKRRRKLGKRAVLARTYGWFGGWVGDSEGGGLGESTGDDQEKLLMMTRAESCVVHPAPPEAELRNDQYHWSFEPDYPVSRISGDAWEEWMKDEIQMWAEEGQPDRFDDMFDRPIEEPIIVVEIDGEAYLWDGCHRSAAAVMQRLKTLPAIVGRPK